MSELDVIQKTVNPNTVESLCNDLQKLGVDFSDILIVHSSMSSIGWVCGEQHAVNMALLKSVGTQGTIIMPSHTGDNSNPEKWESPPVPKEWFEKIREAMPAFDKNISSTRGMGKIAECFRTYPNTLRSNHPQVSFCANGKYAEQITKNHMLTPSFGIDTPLGELYSLNAKILLLGVSYLNCTAFHLSECLSGKLKKVKQGASIKENGQRIWKWFEDYDYDSDDFIKIGEAFEKSSDIVTDGKVGNADCKLFNIKAAVDFAKKWIIENR